MCVFKRKNSHISKKVKDMAKDTIIRYNRKWHTPCQTRWKLLTLDDLEGRNALLRQNGAR